MKLLYGTTNQAKLEHMKQMLSGLDIEIVGLKDAGLQLDVDEERVSKNEEKLTKGFREFFKRTIL